MPELGSLGEYAGSLCICSTMARSFCNLAEGGLNTVLAGCHAMKMNGGEMARYCVESLCLRKILGSWLHLA
jgi:hypothetical protein